jgi:LAS superfamily LD-carboxypeptidase LdcB
LGLERFDADALKTFPAAFEQLKAQKLLSPKMTFAELHSALDQRQKDIVAQILKLDPKDYGVNTPYAGDLEDVPADLVLIQGQQYTVDGEVKMLADKYAPRPVYDAFTRMNEVFRAEHPARRLLIDACYRSPAYQVVVFINWLTSTYGGDIARTIRHASPPAYSQHTIASKAAVDVRTVDGSPSDKNPDDFRETLEYTWLCRHAQDFSFYESWPKDNPSGMRPEPWHWQYLKD